MYEVFEHTADLGLHVVAPDLDALFEDAARALFSVLAEDLEQVRPEREVEVRLAGGVREDLLVDWLSELLFRFERDRLLFSAFEVSVSEAGLVGRARGEPFDAARHRLEHEVKAITYHGLELERAGEAWEARVIVDI